jgi:hypothetical protein
MAEIKCHYPDELVPVALYPQLGLHAELLEVLGCFQVGGLSTAGIEASRRETSACLPQSPGLQGKRGNPHFAPAVVKGHTLVGEVHHSLVGCEPWGAQDGLEMLVSLVVFVNTEHDWPCLKANRNSGTVTPSL